MNNNMTLNGGNTALLEELYNEFKKNPANVSGDWAVFFYELEKGLNGKVKTQQSSTVVQTNLPIQTQVASNLSDDSPLSDMGIINLLNAYRRQGHLAANLDPLGIKKPNRKFIDRKLGELGTQNLDKVVGNTRPIPGPGVAKIRDVIAWYEKTYCNTIGSEQYYLVNDEEREWIQRQMESTANSYPLLRNERLRLFKKLFQADYFEKFLAKKYVGKKRFSLEGGESFIPMMDAIVEEAGFHGMEHLVIGMAHRGRLNLLVNIIDKPASQVFAEFEENVDPNLDYADVKYHLGYSNARVTECGKEVKLSLMFNPSHLEAVNPVATGSVRARQKYYKDMDRSKFMPITVHGDAAFAGQGVVAETLNLMGLEGYTVGGTMHIVINNQIGFTTLPEESRSTLYATDLAKGFQIPIFHVNGDDPEAVHRVVKLSMDYRQKFHKDVIIDLVCYRRLGHNETDEPAFTQPYMYEVIKGHKTTVEIYEEELLKSSDIHIEDLEKIKNDVRNYLEDSFNETKTQKITIQVDTMKGVWSNYSKESLDSQPATTLLAAQLENIVRAITTVPQGFQPNSKLVRLLDSRYKMGTGELPIDWGFAEAISFGSILANGFHIRLSGQDAQRGTFSHRHAVLVDVNKGERYIPLNHISGTQGDFEVINSALSEYSVLGFEYGYSLSYPSSMVIWEAQFGDFSNNAQVIFDQFISSSEVKWQRLSGLVVLLPHGYEGQGPEHSSARLERYLQLCANDNMQVCNCTTPAQYFHLLRRQILRNYRKPLIVLTPKSLLRHPMVISKLEDITTGAFKEVIEDTEVSNGSVKKILFCNGKVYYDLYEERKKRGVKDTAIIRIEQLYPFPKDKIAEILKSYKPSVKLMWVQEEPHNQGSWLFLKDIFDDMFNTKNKLKYVGRKEYPSPAAGHVKVHNREQQELVAKAFDE
jgi:2-oxoglutarate dehydrogenase E1 component